MFSGRFEPCRPCVKRHFAMTSLAALSVSIAPILAFLVVTASSGEGRAVLPELSGPAVVSDEKAHVLEAVAESAFQEKRYLDAIRLYSEAVKRWPDRSSFFLGRGMAYEMANKPKAASQDYATAIRLDPRNYRAMENLAGILERTGGATEQAIGLYKRALELDPRPVWRENLGVWIKMLETGLRPDTESPVGAWHAGNARAQQGKLEDAAAYYARAIELSPQFFQAYYSNALLRIRIGDVQGALADLDAAIDISPGLRGAMVQRALIYEHLGKRSRAMNELRRAVKADSRDPVAHYHLGRMMQEDGQYAAALESFQQALRLKPKPDLRTLIYRSTASMRDSPSLDGEHRARIRRMLQQLW